MKYTVLLMTLFFNINLFAQGIDLAEENKEVLEVIFDQSHESTLNIEEDTFIPNIMGYACPVPAINLNRFAVWHRALNHNRFANFGVKEFALQVKDPNMRFCAWPSAKEVFSEDFEVGNKIKIVIRTRREIISMRQFDGTIRKVLVEKITSSLGGKDLISTAQIDLGFL